MYVYIYVRWLHLCAHYRRRYRTARREDWTGQHAKFHQVIFARDTLRPYWCIVRRLKAEIDREEAAYCFIRTLQCDFRSFYSLAGRRSPTTDRNKVDTKIQIFFPDLTIFVTSNPRVKSRLTALIWKLTAQHRAKLNYFCLEGDSALYFVSSIMFLHLCIDASRAISTTRAVIDM